MSKFKVGDIVKRITCANHGVYCGNKWILPVGTVCVVTAVYGDMLYITGHGLSKGVLREAHSSTFFELTEVQAPLSSTFLPPFFASDVDYGKVVVKGGARSNDPDTSKKAARKPRESLRDKVFVLFASNIYRDWTGKEVANYLDAPLNSVTPRFAELRRAGTIKDSGLRRDGQIVWVLA